MQKNQIKSRFLILTATLAILGCSLVEDPEYITLEKCKISSRELFENEELTIKAIRWKSMTIPKPENSKEALNQLNKSSALIHEYMNGDGSLKKSVLRDWHKSDYCKKLLVDYQEFETEESNIKQQEANAKAKDFSEAIARQAAIYSKSLASSELKEIPCTKFKDQFEFIYKNDATLNFRSDLTLGLRGTISDSLFKLKIHQQEYAKSQLDEKNLENFSREIYSTCRGENLLSDELKEVNSISTSTSSRSIAIINKIELLKENKSCGEISEIYCLFNIKEKAGRSALAVSKKCDESNDAEMHCKKNAEEIFADQITIAEKDILTQEKQKHEAYIENPFNTGTFNSANARGNIDNIREKCDQAAISRGLKGPDFQKHTKEICEPNARREFLQPQILTLHKINARLKQLESPPSTN